MECCYNIHLSTGSWVTLGPAPTAKRCLCAFGDLVPRHNIISRAGLEDKTFQLTFQQDDHLWKCLSLSRTSFWGTSTLSVDLQGWKVYRGKRWMRLSSRIGFAFNMTSSLKRTWGYWCVVVVLNEGVERVVSMPLCQQSTKRDDHHFLVPVPDLPRFRVTSFSPFRVMTIVDPINNLVCALQT